MSVNYLVTGNDGNELTTDTNELFENLKEAGYNPQNVSPDGMIFTLQDSEGTYEVKAEDLLGKLGWKVGGAMPQDADFSAVNPRWRIAVDQLPDDDMRRAYIEGQLKRSGHTDVQITGSGRDWYAFNPTNGEWIGLTNSPEWDMSDLAEGAMKIPQLGGILAGSALGGLPGLVAGGIAGDAIGRGIAGFNDPIYRQVAANDPRSMLADMGTNAAINTGVGLGGMALGRGGAALASVGGAGKLASMVRPIGRGMQAAGNAMAPVSRSAQAVAPAIEGVGNVTAVAGKALSSPMGRGMAAYATPATAPFQMAADVAQLPAQAIRGAPRAASWLGKRDITRNVLGEETAANMAKWGDEMLQAGTRSATPAEKLGARAMRGQGRAGRPVDTRVEDVVANRAARAGTEPSNFAMSGARGLDLLERTGRTVQRAVEAPFYVAGKAAQGAGRVTQAAGRGLRNTGAVGEAVEPYAYGQFGAEELFPRQRQQAYEALRRRRTPATMSEEILAQQ